MALYNRCNYYSRNRKLLMLMKEMLSQSSETHQQSSDSQGRHYDRSNAALVIGVVLVLVEPSAVGQIHSHQAYLEDAWQVWVAYAAIIIGFVILITSMRNES